MKGKNKRVYKGINFVPDFMIKEKIKIKRMFAVGIITTVVTLIAFGVYFIPELRIFTLTTQIESADSEIRFYADIEDIYNKMKATKEKLDSKKQIINEISKDEVDILALIDKLTIAAPKNVLLSYVNVAEKREISVSYVINNPIEANTLVDNLRNLNIFEQVDMPSIPIVDRKTDMSFKLKLKNTALRK